MTKKLIFFDIDGTLMDFDKKIPESTKTVIQNLREKGHDVAIATGRAPFFIEEVCDQLDIHSYITYNGQYVVYEDKVIYENHILPQILEDVQNFARTNHHPMVFMGAKDMKANVDNHPYVRAVIGSLKVDLPGFKEDYFNDTLIYQALLFCRTGEEVAYERFKELKFVRWHDVSTDILPANGSKAEGIKKMLAHLNYSQSDVIAFGDGLNDMEMIRFAGTGVAMGNAVPELKDIADFITKPVDQNGIADAVKALALI